MRVEIFDRMDECTEQEVERLLPLVSEQRREQALRYKHTVGRFCCLKSWLMIYDLLDEGMKGLMDEWSYNEHGKPFIHHTPYTIHFSISHCKEGIAVAVDDQPIGIDIEGIRHAEEDLIERVMNEQERQGMDERKFTRLWTQKEAVVKAQGVGIVSFEQLQKILVESGEWKVERYDYLAHHGSDHNYPLSTVHYQLLQSSPPHDA